MKKPVKIISLILSLTLLCLLFSFVSCDQSSNSIKTEAKKYSVTKSDALEKAKKQFEQEIEYSNKDGFTKVYSPTYGNCEVKDYDEDYWSVTLRGNYKGYKDQYASGKLYTQNFYETYHIKKYEYR